MVTRQEFKKTFAQSLLLGSVLLIGCSVVAQSDSLWIHDYNKNVVGHQSEYVHPYFEQYGVIKEEAPIMAYPGDGTTDLLLDNEIDLISGVTSDVVEEEKEFGIYKWKRIEGVPSYPESTAAFVLSVKQTTEGEEIPVSRGTASFISDNVLITGAHVLYNRTSGSFADAVYVYPIANGYYSGFPKYKAVERYIFGNYALLPKYGNLTVQMFEDDLAMIKIAEPVGKKVGTLGLKAVSSSESYTGKTVTITGYPRLVESDFAEANLYSVSGIVDNANDKLLTHKLDTRSGFSGSALYDTNNMVLGVHVMSSDNYNGASKITPQRLSEIRKFISGDASGWRKNDGVWRYHNKNGIFKTGWFLDPTVQKYYYFNNVGSMLTGWIQPDHRWFYLNEGGDMAVGWKQINGKWFFLKESGEMATGWIKPDGKYYYLKENGEMAIGWIQPNAYWYYLRENGEMATGWLEEGGRTFYLSESGAMLTGTHVIDGVTYTFDIYGALQK